MNPSMQLPQQASVVIVGAGIRGLALAFNLAELKVKNILVLDAGYWQGGASGRNGTLIRGAFSWPEWTRFFAHSNRLWLGLSMRLGENVMYSRRGYTMVGERDTIAQLLQRTLQVHRDCGIDSGFESGRRPAARSASSGMEKVACPRDSRSRRMVIRSAIEFPERGAARLRRLSGLTPCIAPPACCSDVSACDEDGSSDGSGGAAGFSSRRPSALMLRLCSGSRPGGESSSILLWSP